MPRFSTGRIMKDPNMKIMPVSFMGVCLPSGGILTPNEVQEHFANTGVDLTANTTELQLDRYADLRKFAESDDCDIPSWVSSDIRDILLDLDELRKKVAADKLPIPHPDEPTGNG